MKKINLAVCLLFMCIAVSAQKHEPVNQKKDRREFKGYTIGLMPAPSGTYGYRITKDKELVAYQSRNPFTFSSEGLRTKEDAFKVAQWQVEQLSNRQAKKITAMEKRTLPSALLQKMKQQNSTFNLSNRRISSKVADQLHITVKP